jgi:hypothetical protein
MPRIIALLTTVTVLIAGHAQAAIVLHTTDFISDGTRSRFMGFEGLPATYRGSPTYSEGGILIQQVNGDGNDIWTTFLPPEGSRSWYPSSGDYGYTRLTLQGGADFEDVGFLLKSGWAGVGSPTSTVLYELFENGALVQSGTLPGVSYDGGPPMGMYLGFSGGGFDEIWLRDAKNTTLRRSLAFNDGSVNALSIDSIETSGGNLTLPGVPEPASLFAWCIFGVGFALSRIRHALLTSIGSPMTRGRQQLSVGCCHHY